MPFDREYFGRQYQQRAWRPAGAKPILDRTRVRWLRKYTTGNRLLEIGCGLGHFSRAASRRFDVIATDLDLDVLRSVRDGASIRCVVASANALPVADRILDAVCCFDVLEHLPVPESCLAEAFRALRPGGVLFISVPNPGSLGARRKGAESFIFRDPTHCSVRTPDEWRRTLTAAGFDEIWSATDGLWDPPYVRMVPRRVQWLAFVGMTQLAWLAAPGFPWSYGENFTWLGRRPT